MERELRVIISGGGTGGHIFPAVSIANAVKALRPDAKIPEKQMACQEDSPRLQAAGCSRCRWLCQQCCPWCSEQLRHPYPLTRAKQLCRISQQDIGQQGQEDLRGL